MSRLPKQLSTKTGEAHVSSAARARSLAARARSSALSYLLLDANLSSPAAAARAIKMQGIPACCGNGKEVANPGIKTWL